MSSQISQAAYVERRLGRPRAYLAARRDAAMRVPDEIAECVVYVGCTEIEDGVERDFCIGTAFLVFHEDRDLIFHYLVTADHVVRDVAGKRAWLRVNLKAGGVEKVSIENVTWFRHPSEAANVDAALCVSTLGSEYQIAGVPTRLFIQSEDDRNARGVGIGDECCTLGLFVFAQGEHRNTPLLRYGTIAMVPHEPVQTEDYGAMQAYLTEARSLPGSSGAPVIVRESLLLPFFVAHTGEEEPEVYPTASGSFFLLGVMHGYFWDRNVWRGSQFDGPVNLGLSVVVPAEKIMQILAQPGLAEQRDRAAAQAKKKARRVRVRGA